MTIFFPSMFFYDKYDPTHGNIWTVWNHVHMSWRLLCTNRFCTQISWSSKYGVWKNKNIFFLFLHKPFINIRKNSFIKNILYFKIFLKHLRGVFVCVSVPVFRERENLWDWWNNFAFLLVNYVVNQKKATCCDNFCIVMRYWRKTARRRRAAKRKKR